MLYNTPKPQDTKEGLSDQDFSIYMDAHTVPFSKYPSYLPEGVLGMCTEGNAEIQIGLRKYVICANDILIFMPGFLVSFIKSSLTFTIDYCTFSNALFYDVINGSIKRFPTGFHTYTQTHCIYSLSQEKAGNHSIFRHDNFIGCFSADKIKKSVRKYFCFNIPVYKNMAEEPSCRSYYHEEYIQTSASGNPEDLCH